MPAIGLVLGAGGLTGHAYHVGVLGAVEQALGCDVRDAAVIVGTSAGAGVGALLRAGLSVADLRARIEGRPLSPAGAALVDGVPEMEQWPPFQWPRGRRRPAALSILGSDLVRPWRFRAGHLLAAGLPEGVVSTASLQALHDHLHRGRRWPDAPLWITTVRLRDGRRVVLGRDAPVETTVGTAVVASSAIPGYFAPVLIGGERYVDGGTHSPTNAHLLRGLDLDVIVVSSPMSSRPSRAMAASTGWNTRLLGRPYHHPRLRREVAALRRDCPGALVLVFEPTPADQLAMGLSALDRTPMPTIVASADASATARLARRAASASVVGAAGAAGSVVLP